MRRFWVDADKIAGEIIRLDQETFHHIIDVCRMAEQDRFEIMSEDLQAYFVVLEKVGKKQATARILEQRTLKALPKPHLHLALSIPRPQTLDAIAEKAVELGVKSLRLFTSEHSFVRKPKDFPAARTQRLQRILQAARQQSARGEPLDVAPVTDLENVLTQFQAVPAARGLFAFEGQAKLRPKPYLEAVSKESFEQMWIFVGSEGGFSHEEARQFGQAGLEAVTLGDQILRVETACVALVSIIKYALQVGF